MDPLSCMSLRDITSPSSAPFAILLLWFIDVDFIFIFTVDFGSGLIYPIIKWYRVEY